MIVKVVEVPRVAHLGGAQFGALVNLSLSGDHRGPIGGYLNLKSLSARSNKPLSG